MFFWGMAASFFPMGKKVLITGGAGFIGSHLADTLLKRGYAVRALDNLSPQVHGAPATRPDYLDRDVELLIGDVRDRSAVGRALRGVDAVFHFAAMVGVGQSMYQPTDYTSVNNDGTAMLMQCLIEHPIERLVVASSMSLYGEGLYCDGRGDICEGIERSVDQLSRRDWEVRAPDGSILTPISTGESKHPNLASVYALSKFDQERLCLILGRAYKIPTVALRFFNVYGPRQSLSNPYTGVMAIFASRLLNKHQPMIFEDGLQRRDFVSVHDIAQACLLALESSRAAGKVFNVGSGNSYTIRELALKISDVMGKDIEPRITGQYRVGDIRHCFADITLARQVLGYAPKVSLEGGLMELVDWLKGQVAEDHVEQASAELASRGLTV
jgi:dTDP-L-rhamnose 4-epimerase